MSLPDPDPQYVISVSQLTADIKLLLEGQPGWRDFWLQGELSNLTRHSSGNIYFSLKDQNAQINCSFFRNYQRGTNAAELREGQQVLVRGSVSVYPPHGRYQIIVKSIRPLGMGEIKLRLEQLRRQLFEEGLFDPARKKALPFYPRRLGVVTAPTGAALRDIIRVARSRNPNIDIVLAPCKVQGDDAPATILRALEVIQDPRWGVDLILLGRGGGSFEDLLAFSDEAVVRAVADCKLPLVSAVGHEIDHPICDEAADRAAATPSAGAEICVPEKWQMEGRLRDLNDRLNYSLRVMAEGKARELENLVSRPVWERPREVVEERRQYLDELARRFRTSARHDLENRRNLYRALPRLDSMFRREILRYQNQLLPLAERLENFSPLATLKRGFSLARDGKGKILRSSEGVRTGDRLEIILGEGRLETTVERVHAPGTGESENPILQSGGKTI